MSNWIKCIVPALALLVAGFVTLSATADDKAPAAAKGSISGVVNGTDGKPAGNVNIWLRPPKEKATKAPKKESASIELAGKPADLEAEVTTDAEGKFSIKDVVVGKHVLTAKTEDGKLFARENVEVKEGQDTAVTLTLKENVKKQPAK